MNRVLLITMTTMVVLLLAYNVYMSYPSAYVPESAPVSVDYIDLGCDDSLLEEIERDGEVFRICRGIGEICRQACDNTSAPEIQAYLGKGNTVKCRCVRG